jgi:hypothetical protein
VEVDLGRIPRQGLDQTAFSLVEGQKTRRLSFWSASKMRIEPHHSFPVSLQVALRGTMCFVAAPNYLHAL